MTRIEKVKKCKKGDGLLKQRERERERKGEGERERNIKEC
jgi:hypothetical protein